MRTVPATIISDEIGDTHDPNGATFIDEPLFALRPAIVPPNRTSDRQSYDAAGRVVCAYAPFGTAVASPYNVHAGSRTHVLS
jgi:hypothetical protein